MTNPDFRAELQRLVGAYEEHGGKWPDHHEQALFQAVEDARAALAQPKPQAPTDEELIEPIVWMIDDRVYDNDKGEIVQSVRELIARWGTPAIQSVPVNERLPGPEDCDAEGGCWWWHPDHKEDDFDDGWILLNPKWAGGRRDSDDSLIYTHWLPHWALPVPTPANTINQEDYDRG